MSTQAKQKERAIPPGLPRGKAAVLEQAWQLFDQAASAWGPDHAITHAAARTVTLAKHASEAWSDFARMAH